MEYRLDNIQFSLPNGAIFSIACIDGKSEVAVMNEEGFVPVSVWFDGNGDDSDPILPIAQYATSLDKALDTAIKWAQDDKNGEMARALDQMF